jgi:hypothetical protein
MKKQNTIGDDVVDAWKAFEGAMQIERLRIWDYQRGNISAKDLMSGLVAIKERLYEVQRTAQDKGDEILCILAKDERENILSKIGEIVMGFSRSDLYREKRDRIPLPARRS